MPEDVVEIAKAFHEARRIRDRQAVAALLDPRGKILKCRTYADTAQFKETINSVTA